MPVHDAPARTSSGFASLSYAPIARALHWAVATLVIVTVPVGIVMVDRGARDIWDATTNTLYSTHKLIGFLILTLMLVRLGYRLANPPPAQVPTLSLLEKVGSEVVHWALYAMLIVVPMLGWLGISYYPALDIFGINVPGLVTPNEDTSKRVFLVHKLAAFVLVGLALLHIAAALFHGFVKRDGVLSRMWPGAGLPRV